MRNKSSIFSCVEKILAKENKKKAAESDNDQTVNNIDFFEQTAKNAIKYDKGIFEEVNFIYHNHNPYDNYAKVVISAEEENDNPTNSPLKKQRKKKKIFLPNFNKTPKERPNPFERLAKLRQQELTFKPRPFSASVDVTVKEKSSVPVPLICYNKLLLKNLQEKSADIHSTNNKIPKKKRTLEDICFPYLFRRKAAE